MKKRLYRSIGLCTCMMAMVAFVIYAGKVLRGQDLSQYTTVASMQGIIIATLIYTLNIPLSAHAWRRLLSDGGIKKPWTELGMIMGITQMAKYLPGNVGQHIGRGAMSLSHGIGIKPFTVTIVVESFLTVIAALIVGIAGVALSQKGLTIVSDDIFTILTLGVFCSCCIIIILLASHRWLPLLLTRYAPNQDWGHLLEYLPRRTSMFTAMATYSLNLILFGFGIVIIARFLLPHTVSHDNMLLAGSFALAWVVGFFTPGASAGLGVREVVMMGLLSTTYSESNAIVVILALRLVTTIGDALCFVVANGILLISHYRKRYYKCN